MARPAYILLAKSFVQDRETNSLSVFEIIERVEISPLPKSESPDKPVILTWEPMRLVAVWMAEPDDNFVDGKSDEYEFENFVNIPGHELQKLSSGKFTFDQQKPLQRMLILFASPLPISEAGVVRFESRIRTNNEPWISQEYWLGIDKADSAK